MGELVAPRKVVLTNHQAVTMVQLCTGDLVVATIIIVLVGAIQAHALMTIVNLPRQS